MAVTGRACSVRRGRRVLLFLTAYLLLPLHAACATTGPPAEKSAERSVEKTFLELLEDGRITKQMVILKLGKPTGSFEGERILTYRIGRDEEGFLYGSRGVARVSRHGP